MQDGTPCHIVCGLIAGFVAVMVGNPVDVVKTRLMNQSADNPTYKGGFHCLTKVAMNEGPLALYKGALANFARIGSFNVSVFVTVE